MWFFKRKEQEKPKCHVWGQWSKPFNEAWTKAYIATGREYHYNRVAQERTCTLCGEYQKRYIGD